MNELVERILKLKRDRNAVILAHNYQRPEIQDIADFVGDSLGLSQSAAKTEADVIVFCGVHFMAETAYILSPQKTVVMPDPRAGCPMANMIHAEQLREMKKQHPGVPVVCYINTTADVKAECDYCCTSANAAKVVNAVTADTVIFVPDQYLGHWVSTQVSKKIILWNGYCHVHRKIMPEDIQKVKAEHPAAEVVVHPECIPQVIALADKVASTSGMVKYVQESAQKEFILGTEEGILHRMKKEAPGKKFYPARSDLTCPNMKLTTLEKVLWVLEDLENKITVPEEIRLKAKRSIDRMLEIV